MHHLIVKIAKELHETRQDESQPVKKNSLLGAAALSALGANMIRQSTPDLLGYHVVYHGTTKDAGKSIRENGLSPKFGGKGGGISSTANLSESISNSKNHIYVTKNRYVSKGYAGMIDHINKSKAATHGIDANTFNSGVLRHSFLRKGDEIKIRLTDNQWKRFQVDPEGGAFASKDLAARSKHAIPSRQIAGGKGSRGILSVVNANTLRRHIGSESGRARLARGMLTSGIGLAVTSTGLTALGKGIGKKESKT